MKLTTKLDKLTKEQEELLNNLEFAISDEESLARDVIDEEVAWEQWCDSHEDAFTTYSYSESSPYYYPAGAVFEEVEGPEGFEDVGEDEIWETSEGKMALDSARTAIKVIQKNIDDILVDKEKWYYDIYPEIDLDEYAEGDADTEIADVIIDNIIKD